MHKSKLKQISLAVCLALMPFQGFAAGLGKLNVNSGLGEPLRAEIELLSLTPDELASLSAVVAPEEAYAVQGIPRLSIHNNIKVELSKAADGSPILKLNSAQPVSDPYLDMLIQVDWSSGRLLREYTILLDPPEYKTAIKDAAATPTSVINKPASSVAPATSSQQTANQQTADVQASAKSRKSKSTTAKSEPVQEYAAAEATADPAELTTRRGDSLAAIAREVKPDGVSLDQVLVGLFEANKHAFVDSNMNRLKVGQILKVPARDTLLATDSKQASQEVKLHSSNWNVYRNSLAGNVAAADAAEQTQEKQSSTGKISTAEDLAAAKKAGPQDVVKLSAGGKATGKEAGAGYDAKVLALQEETTAKEKALKEAQERTAALEAQIADMQKLLALKNQAMANVQQNAQAAVPKSAAAAPVAEAKPAQTQPASPAPTAEAKPMPAEADAAQSNAASTVKPAAPVAKPAPNAADVKKAPTKPSKPVVIPEPIEEPSLLDSIIEGIDLMLLAVAGGLALLVAGWVYLRNKRRRDLDSFERGILTSGGLSANTVFGNTTGNASTSDTSFLTDFAQSADGSMIDTNDVDPIAEAEVYMAYGRDAQAEEILKDAIVKEPKRYELHLKLLEMYAARKDISAFEAIAGELYTTLGSGSPTWAKVAELGVTVEPDNPLYDLSQLTTQPVDSANQESISSSEKANLEKDLDWEKELDLDKELAFATDFSGQANPAVQSESSSNMLNAGVDVVADKRNEVVGDDVSVVTQFGNAGAELNQEQSLSMSDSAMPDFATPDSDTKNTLREEVALFAGVDTPAVQDSSMQGDVAPNLAADNAPESDNSLNFDFSELGKFSADSAESVSVVDESAEQASNTLEFAPAFELPEASAEGTASQNNNLNEIANPTEENTALDLSFEGLNQDSSAAPEKPAAVSFEAIDFSVNQAEQSESLLDEELMPQAETVAMPDLSGISLDLNDVPVTQEAQSSEIQFDLPTVEDTIEIAMPAVEVEPEPANEFDLASINLELSDTPELNQVEVNEAVSMQAEASEDPDVDIKLDLVKVYIDMEDVEGARDLLDEVMKEGGPKQRQTAEQLLASLT